MTAWIGRLLCNRYRRLSARGVQHNKVCVAIARELLGFVWDIILASGLLLRPDSRALQQEVSHDELKRNDTLHRKRDARTR